MMLKVPINQKSKKDFLFDAQYSGTKYCIISPNFSFEGIDKFKLLKFF